MNGSEQSDFRDYQAVYVWHQLGRWHVQQVYFAAGESTQSRKIDVSFTREQDARAFAASLINPTRDDQ